jgi:hypothetical protein
MDFGIRVASPCIRAALAAALALVVPACTYPKFLGEEPTDGGSSTEDIVPASTSSQGSAASTGVVTGDETASTGVVTGDETATDPTTCADGCPGGAPGGPIEKCISEFNEEYWCECTEGDSHPCGDGRVSVCLAQDAVVFTHTRWTTCGTCEPGQQRACDAPAGPGRQFCNLHDVWIDDIEDLPMLEWGACLREQDITCEPGESRQCEGGIAIEQCDVDLQGMPHWTGC